MSTQPTCPQNGSVSLYAMGELDAHQRAAFETHMDGCPACEEALSALSPALEALANGCATTPAPAHLHQALRRRIQAQDMPGVHLQMSNPAGFLPTPRKGLFIRPLHVDHANGRVTFLLRLEAGHSYPPHRHQSHEECFVLEGSVDVGDVHMQAGDYVFADAGSEHPEHVTREGCLLYFTAGLADHPEMAALG